MRLTGERERLSGMFDTAGCSSSVDKLDHGQEYWEKGGWGGSHVYYPALGLCAISIVACADGFMHLFRTLRLAGESIETWVLNNDGGYKYPTVPTFGSVLGTVHMLRLSAWSAFHKQ